jgi:hypothetical protein
MIAFSFFSMLGHPYRMRHPSPRCPLLRISCTVCDEVLFILPNILLLALWLDFRDYRERILLSGLVLLYGHGSYYLLHSYLDLSSLQQLVQSSIASFDHQPTYNVLGIKLNRLRHRCIDPPNFSDSKEYHELVLEAKRHLGDLLPEIEISEKFLLAPRKYQTFLENARGQLKTQLHCLGYDDDKIDNLCGRLNQVLAEAEKLLALMWLLEALLYFWTLVITVCFFEFPSNLRPPCTTMPWNILPALFVLWGVCWMFVNEASVLSSKEANANTSQGEVIYSSDILRHSNICCRW